MTRLLGKAAAVAGGLALLTGVALAGAPAAGAAAAGAAASNQILNWNSDLCLGINGGGGEWGRTAIQWDCNGNPDQKWNFWASSGSYSTVKNENGLCLGIRNASTGLGAEALQWQCNGNADQTWYFG
ncbi:RICIN domain-containing protein [Streptomyces virginiae]|uniref:RICIN domain-containing protein n=1 Tax=Streptomyces virginiae TaxID=1961 RepID=UPI0030CBEE95